MKYIPIIKNKVIFIYTRLEYHMLLNSLRDKIQFLTLWFLSLHSEQRHIPGACPSMQRRYRGPLSSPTAEALACSVAPVTESGPQGNSEGRWEQGQIQRAETIVISFCHLLFLACLFASILICRRRQYPRRVFWICFVLAGFIKTLFQFYFITDTLECAF